MAGEVEESYNINSQADSIHSGSISFGRFEKEPLSWERRSSFSHNRYLEEIEKCSKPGLVIEKKAYFEAHFRKKGLLGILSSTGHDGSDQTTGENNGSERISDQEDFESNEDGHYVEFDKRSQDDFEPNEDGHSVQFEQRSQEDFEQNEDGHYIQFDECPDNSNYHGKTEYEREDAFREVQRVSFSNPQRKYTMNSSNVLEDVIDKSIASDEVYQAKNEISNMLSVSVIDESITEMRKSHDDTVNSDESLRIENIIVTEAGRGVKETTLHDPINPSLKEKRPDPAVNSPINNVRIKKTTSRPSKDPGRNPSRVSLRRTNIEKNISKLATPTTQSVSRIPKEVSRNEEKVNRESKSEKVSRMKKASESQPSVLKSDSRGIQEAKRLNQTVESTKSDLKPIGAAFNFKSSERAERRKEFNMKFEEKLHAKEVEMNQMQAISQEKTEVEIKKLRKTLNFKAAPMPSFYHTALPSHSDGNKAVTTNTRSKNAQKPKCQGSRADSALPSNLKAGNDHANKSVSLTEPHRISVENRPTSNASEATLIHPARPTSRSCLPNSVMNNQISRKKERAKATLQNHRSTLDSRKGAKRQSNEGKQKGETPKCSNEIRKKGMRNNGVQSNSRNGNPPLRVASGKSLPL